MLTIRAIVEPLAGLGQDIPVGCQKTPTVITNCILINFELSHLTSFRNCEHNRYGLYQEILNL